MAVSISHQVLVFIIFWFSASAEASTRPLGNDPYYHHRSAKGFEHSDSSASERSLPLGKFSLKAISNSQLANILSNDSSHQAEKEPSLLDAVKFMKKFGYVPAGTNQADFIFSSETLKEKLKLVQKFGALPETGELDDATAKLMVSPRCGVHDVEEAAEGSKRKKRYILGSAGGWNKRKLTYSVANWTPKLASKEVVSRELRRAFDAWSQYSHLQFTEIDSNEADIIIFFASYHHNDNYPFDGEGGILAHAYYPKEFGHFGGDIHFDESENWIIEPDDSNYGLDFFTVAVHEIGHSLGLSHSPVSTSIMFPYYKGYEQSFHLDYDDVMGMWELYIKRRLDGDDEYFNTTTTTTTTTSSPDIDYGNEDDNEVVEDDYHGDEGVRYHGDSETVDEHEDRKKGTNRPSLPPLYPQEEDERKRRDEKERKRDEERKWKQQEEEERRRWETERRRHEEDIRNREEEERRRWEEEEEKTRQEWESGSSTTTRSPSTKPADRIPNICDGSFDSVALIRDELFIFKGKYMWRYRNRGHLLPGYPTLIHSMFSDLPVWIQKIDAVYERKNDSNIVFFVGKYYYVHDGIRLLDGSPRPLTDYGIPESITQLDAIFYWPKNQRTYLFWRNLYWRRNDFENKMDDNYPREMKRWNGIPEDLDGVVTYNDGNSYFFKKDQIWQYDNESIRPTYDSPTSTLTSWTGC